MSTPRSDEELRETVLLAAIVDVQGAIRSIDAKCSAALVVHGLMFAGSLGIATKLGTVYVAAPSWALVIGVVLLVVASAAFLVSVHELLRALRPYRPAGLDVVDHDRPGVFFPLPDDLGEGAVAWQQMKARVASLGHDNVVTELALERAKLAYILQHESNHANVGYLALIVEVVAVVAFLLFVAAIAATQL